MVRRYAGSREPKAPAPVRVELVLSLMAFGQPFVVPYVEAQACLPYEPAVVTLEGTVTMGAFPGRPNYADTLHGDEIERPFILQLDRAICVEPDSSSRLYNDPRGGVRQVQLAVVGDSLVLRLRRLVGRRIVVTGQLFSAETGHHHTPVLDLVRELRGAAAR